MNSREQFLMKAYEAALRAPHLWPGFAACEAALESGWGTSRLCTEGNNLFGEKQHAKPIYQSIAVRTWEDENGNGQPDPNEYRVAVFVRFPDWDSSFRSRMATLRRLAEMESPSGKLLYPHYGAALAAQDGPTFIQEVSQEWSTDPYRADKVLAIYRAHGSIFPAETH